MACLLIALIAIAGCQRAQQYPPAEKTIVKTPLPPPADLDHRWRWREPDERRDVPIKFVTDTSPEWRHLPAYWSPYPLAPLYLGQMPLEAAAAVMVTDHLQAIKIKVPRGLEDPAKHIPPGNPPTLGKWMLGRALFHKSAIRVGDAPFSCATCHDPNHAFSDGRNLARGMKRNTLSLINVAYNRRQFWDGRVETLEETLVRSLDDERTMTAEDRAKAVEQHVFGGFVRSLIEKPDRRLMELHGAAFGYEQLTQDTAARSLATYMRTLLAGDSLYDRAVEKQREQKAETLSVAHVRLALTDAEVARLSSYLPEKVSREVLATRVFDGYTLFQGRLRCAECHKGPLFTDHDYHNVGYSTPHENDPEGLPPPGVETARALQVSIGLKEARFIGAFRTPSLRNLGKSGPYFHNGTLASLPQVVDFFDAGIGWNNPYIAHALRGGGDPLRSQLKQEERDALLLFLRSLEGEPVDASVAGVPK
jgi:cytochrome c peroxidase